MTASSGESPGHRAGRNGRIELPPPGRRVVVRYRLPGGQATDALGMLLSADSRTLVVDGKRGQETIAVTDVIAAKEVPPAPEPRVRRTAT